MQIYIVVPQTKRGKWTLEEKRSRPQTHSIRSFESSIFLLPYILFAYVPTFTWIIFDICSNINLLIPTLISHTAQKKRQKLNNGQRLTSKWPT